MGYLAGAFGAFFCIAVLGRADFLFVLLLFLCFFFSLVGQGAEHPSGTVTVRVLPLDISVLSDCSESPGIWVSRPLRPFRVSQAPSALVLARAEDLPALAACLPSKMHECSPPDLQGACPRSRGITVLNAEWLRAPVPPLSA